jgi:multidrug transporter EmrE-like cation transporter
MAHNSISLAAPIMAGSAFVMTAVAGLVFFSEPINMVKAAGIFLVFSGVLLLGTAA